MNSGEINFISGGKKGSFREQQRTKIFKFVALGSLGFVASISIITFLLTALLPMGSIKEEQNRTRRETSSYQAKFAKLHTVNERIMHISEILKKRKNFPSLIDKVLTNIPSDVSIVSMNMDEKELLITANSFSLKQINQFINNFSQLAEEEKSFNKIFIDNLSANHKSGTYSISLKVSLI